MATLSISHTTPIILNLVQDITTVIFDRQNGFTLYKMSMVSREWNIYCNAIATMNDGSGLNNGSREEFELEMKNLNILWILKNCGYYNSFSVMEVACKFGNELIVKILIRHGNNSWDMGLFGACEGGHKTIVNLMLKHGAKNKSTGFIYACKGGHTKLALSLTPKPHWHEAWESGFVKACAGGHLQLAKELIDRQQIGLMAAFTKTCEAGHLDVVKMLITKGATYWDVGLLAASEFAQVAIVELMIQKGATRFCNAIRNAQITKHGKEVERQKIIEILTPYVPTIVDV